MKVAMMLEKNPMKKMMMAKKIEEVEEEIKME